MLNNFSAVVKNTTTTDRLVNPLGEGPGPTPGINQSFAGRHPNADEREKIRRQRCRKMSNTQLSEFIDNRRVSYGPVPTPSEMSSLNGYQDIAMNRSDISVPSSSPSILEKRNIPTHVGTGGDPDDDGEGDTEGNSSDEDEDEEEECRPLKRTRPVKILPLKTVFTNAVASITQLRKMGKTRSVIVASITDDLPRDCVKLGMMINLINKNFSFKGKIATNIKEIGKFNTNALNSTLGSIVDRSSSVSANGVSYETYIDLLECLKTHCELCLEDDNSYSVVILKEAVQLMFTKC